MGSFLKQKTTKTFVYVYNTALLVLGISKKDLKSFWNPCKLSRVVFSVRCNRGFTNFPIMNHYCGSWLHHTSIELFLVNLLY